MKKIIYDLIEDYIKEYSEQNIVKTKWSAPLVGFADINNPLIRELKSIVSKNHKLPEEIMPEASIILSYYVPFTKELAIANKNFGEYASPEWAYAYEETNKMFANLNIYLVMKLKEFGYKSIAPKEALIFDREKLISDWSQRHIARASGLGTFGINNMLITRKGCCGRLGSLITNLDVSGDEPIEDEFCLYKKEGNCGACISRCPSGALALNEYDKVKCYKLLLKNAEIYKDFGNSYFSEKNGEKVNSGSEVCGKCVSGMPCSFWPV